MSELENAIIDALTRMYSEASPGIDYSKVLENPEEYEDITHKHTLSSERQEEIVDDVANEYDLIEDEKTTLRMNAILYYGPQQEQN